MSTIYSPTITETDPAGEISMAQVVQPTLAQEMRRDPNIIVMGEDIAYPWTIFRAFQGLVQEFGS